MTLGKGIEQLQVFATFWAISLLATVVYLFVNGFVKNQLARVICDTIVSFGAILLFFWANLRFNNGEFRLFVFVAVAFGIATSCICFRRTLDKVTNKLYNLFTKPKVDNNGKDFL
ncbi:MAG: hypothetical protein J6Q55_00055 [Clostridia bacterium]|nr:hypothetical protein [Clostridia bacterium]